MTTEVRRNSRSTSTSGSADSTGRLTFVTLPLTSTRRDQQAPYWDHIFEEIGFRPNGPAHVFTIDLESAAYVTFTDDGTMKRLHWPGSGEWAVTKHRGG